MRPPSRRLVPKLAAVVLGCALGGVALWSYAAGSRALQRARYEEQKSRIHELVREHALQTEHGAPIDSPAALSPGSAPASAIDSAIGARPSVAARTPEERAWYLSAELAETLFPRDLSLETYDPWCYFRHKTSQSVHVDWPEHAAGGWTWATNSLGLREDRELSTTRPDLRVLVTGDSHTDGFCDNSESFPHVAEAELARARSGSRIEIVNAGNGGFSFHNYLGVLARFVGLEPDVFVVAVYAGNDFVEVLLPNAYFRRTTLPDETTRERQEKNRAIEISAPASVQAFQELVHFRQHPQAVEQSVRAALSLVSEMHAICDAHGIRMLVLLIPGPHQVAWGENAPLFERFARELVLSPQDLSLTDRVTDVFLDHVREQGIETLDARQILSAETGTWYWKKDFHMNVRAHAAIGRALAQRIASWGGKFAR